MTDRYGEPPAPVQNLVEVARFRLLARRYGLSTTGLRLAFVISCILPGPQFIAYLLLWVLIPAD